MSPAVAVRALALLAALIGATPAAAETLVVELSNDEVSVTSEFAGTKLALFGVIERDAQTVARTGDYHVIVIVEGPPHDVLVQKKDRRAGIWLNAEAERFAALPSYYAVLATEDADEHEADWSRLIDSARIPPAVRHAGPERTAFYDAYARKRAETGLYVVQYGAVEMVTDRFFRTLINLPGIVEDGIYSVTVTLTVGGIVLDETVSFFSVAKVGFEDRLFELSRRQPLIYGILVVLLALVTGYVGGVVFRRN